MTYAENFYTRQKQEIIRRLLIFGLTRTEAHQIASQFLLWVQCSGPEWVVSRLKAMKVSFLQLLANPDMPRKDIFPNIAVKHSIPSGPFKRIFLLKKPQKVLSALMVYSSLVSNELTTKQWRKFYDSAEKPAVDKEFLLPHVFEYDELTKLTNQYRDGHNADRNPFKRIQPLNFAKRKVQARMLHGNRAPLFASDGKTAPWTPRAVVDSFNHQLARKYVMQTYEVYSKNFPEWATKSIFNQYKTITNVMRSLGEDEVGRISFIQEPGFKLRAVANPYPSLQMLLDPLKDTLMDALKQVPNDYCHRQEEAVENIQKELKNRVNLSSVDLSDATNNIPYSLQKRILELLVSSSSSNVAGEQVVRLIHGCQ